MLQGVYASEAATRAGYLSLINMVPAYFGLHLSFVCTLLGVSLPTYRPFHASTGTMSVLLGLLHAVINAIGKPVLGTKESKQVFELIVSQHIPNGAPLELMFALGGSFHRLAAFPFVTLVSPILV